MKLNKAAFDKAKSLITSHQYVKDSDWSDVQPDAERENRYLDDHSFADYREWYLGIHEAESEETKSRLGFPYGDFRRVHRSGLIAAKQRAAQQHYEQIEKAADELLRLLDEAKS